MKICLISDTHQEFRHQRSYLHMLPEDGAVDILIAAGDIDHGSTGLKDLIQMYSQTHIIYVPGNHEFYNSSLVKISHELDELAADVDNVTLFNEYGCYVHENYAFVGGVGWSGPEEPQIRAMINDFRLIKDAAEINGDMKSRFIDYIDVMSDTFVSEGKTVVGISHFLPHYECTHPKFRGYGSDELSRKYFCTNIPSNILNRFTHFFFGHTHDPMDFEYDGTKYICNPRGYPSDWRNADKWTPLILDL